MSFEHNFKRTYLATMILLISPKPIVQLSREVQLPQLVSLTLFESPIVSKPCQTELLF